MLDEGDIQNVQWWGIPRTGLRSTGLRDDGKAAMRPLKMLLFFSFLFFAVKNEAQVSETK